MTADGKQITMDMILAGTDFDHIARVAEAAGMDKAAAVLSLAERFGAPPFSILDTRKGYWQQRKKEWLGLGIQSEVGRDGGGAATKAGKDGLMTLSRRYKAGKEWDDDSMDESALHTTGTSVFDPVLCELMLSWFSTTGMYVLDPFAGGSVRGIVAARLGRHYSGMELRQEQVAANIGQWKAIGPLLGDEAFPRMTPVWMQGDSRHIAQVMPVVRGPKHDMLFTCPPYYDLEVYSEDDADISNAGSYNDFELGYQTIMANACDLLADNTFAVVVVANLRDKRGFYHDLVGDTVRIMAAAQYQLYNEAILINVAGSAPLRVANQFKGNRKLAKVHQNVLVFYRGDPARIKGRLGEVDVVLPTPAEMAEDPVGYRAALQFAQ